MKNLKLSISCEGDSTITMTASFDTPEQAIAFNEKLAALCRSANNPAPSLMVNPLRLLPWPR